MIRRWMGRFTFGLAMVLGGWGCNVGLTVSPPAEAILSGAWNVTLTPDPGLTEVLLFNGDGKLTERRITVGSTTVSQTDVHRLTRVVGNSVRIETSDNNVFEGTLNDTNNVITGTFSTILSIGSTTITTQNGAATLTKL